LINSKTQKIRLGKKTGTKPWKIRCGAPMKEREQMGGRSGVTLYVAQVFTRKSRNREDKREERLS